MDIQEHINVVGKHMVQLVVQGLKNGKIAVGRSKDIGQFFLQTIASAKTEAELSQDLDVMEQQLPEMQEVVRMDRLRNKEAREKEMKAHIEELLKNGKVEEAAALAKGLTQ